MVIVCVSSEVEAGLLANTNTTTFFVNIILLMEIKQASSLNFEIPVIVHSG